MNALIDEALQVILRPSSFTALVTLLAGAPMIVLRVQKEFVPEDDAIEKPHEYAVGGAVSTSKFRENNWKGFRALCAAERFSVYYQRYKLLLDHRSATILFSLLTASCLLLYVVIYLMQPARPVHGLIALFYSLALIFWGLLVQMGSALKEKIKVLRVA